LVGTVVGAVGLFAVAPALASVTYELSPFAGLSGQFAAPTPGPATSSAIDEPGDVAVDAAGNVYIADSDNEEVEKVTPDGQLSIIAGDGTVGRPSPGLATASDLDDPTSVAVDAAGDVYIADNDNCDVEEVTPSGQLSIIAGDGSAGLTTPGPATATSIGQPLGLALNSAGDLYISETLPYSYIFEVTPDGTLSIVAGDSVRAVPTPGPAAASAVDTPEQMAVDAAGNLYVADDNASEVYKITPSGTLSIVAGDGTDAAAVPGPATSSPLSGPYGVALDAAGDMYIVDAYNYAVYEVTPDGTLSVIAGPNSASGYGVPTYGVPATDSLLAFPMAIASTSAGRLYVAETDNPTIDLLVPPVVAEISPPVISGTPDVGDTLTTTTGTWSNDPIIYAYQWEDCNSSGSDCTTITGATSSTYVVTSADAGHTIRVVVTAENGGGSETATAVPTAIVPTPTSPSAPTGGSTAAATQVSIPAKTLADGLDLTDVGGVSLPLACSGSGACVAGVTFALPRSSITRGASGLEVVASVAGAHVASAATTSVDFKLSASVVRALQARGERQVRVTVTLTNTDGTVSTEQLLLHVPAGLDVCPAPTGRISGTTLGPVKLGEAMAQVSARYPRHQKQRYGFERFCFATGGAFRVQHASTNVLTARDQSTLHGKVVVALTANHHYMVDGVHPGTKLAAVSSRLALGTGIEGGANWWYVLPGKASNTVFKVHHGVIQEIGIAVKRLTDTPTQQRELFDQAAKTARK